MPLGKEIGLSPSDIVLDGDPALLPQRWGEPPQFSVHICCRQMPVWMKMPLGIGMEVDLSQSDIVLDGDPAPLSQKGA